MPKPRPPPHSQTCSSSVTHLASAYHNKDSVGKGMLDSCYSVRWGISYQVCSLRPGKSASTVAATRTEQWGRSCGPPKLFVDDQDRDCIGIVCRGMGYICLYVYVKMFCCMSNVLVPRGDMYVPKATVASSTRLWRFSHTTLRMATEARWRCPSETLHRFC